MSPRLNNQFAWEYLSSKVSAETLRTFKDLLIQDNLLVLGSYNFIVSLYHPQEVSLKAEYDEVDKVYRIGYGSYKHSYSDIFISKTTRFDRIEDAQTCLKWDIARFIVPYLTRIIPCWNNLNHAQSVALVSFTHSEGEFFGKPDYSSITRELREFKEKNDNGLAVSETLSIYYQHKDEHAKRRRTLERNLFHPYQYELSL